MRWHVLRCHLLENVYPIFWLLSQSYFIPFCLIYVTSNLGILFCFALSENSMKMITSGNPYQTSLRQAKVYLHLSAGQNTRLKFSLFCKQQQQLQINVAIQKVFNRKRELCITPMVLKWFYVFREGTVLWGKQIFFL